MPGELVLLGVSSGSGRRRRSVGGEMWARTGRLEWSGSTKQESMGTASRSAMNQQPGQPWQTSRLPSLHHLPSLHGRVGLSHCTAPGVGVGGWRGLNSWGAHPFPQCPVPPAPLQLGWLRPTCCISLRVLVSFCLKKGIWHPTFFPTNTFVQRLVTILPCCLGLNKDFPVH